MKILLTKAKLMKMYQKKHAECKELRKRVEEFEAKSAKARRAYWDEIVR